MEWLGSALDFLSGLDREISGFAGERPVLFFVLYAASIFAETGLVVTPFLPSETLVFGVGALASENDHVNVWLGGLLAAGATLSGDTVNMLLGRTLGRRFLLEREGKLLGKRSVRWAERYFERNGARTVFLCRFLPLVRTAAPFLAGMGDMRKRTFLAFNASSAAAWTVLYLAAGYFFGQIEVVERNFAIAVAAVALVAFLPVAVQAWHKRRVARSDEGAGEG